MGTGEYVSMQTQRELFEHRLSLERAELAADPEGERAELVEIYRAKGLDEEAAIAVADRILSDPAVALDTMAREELGLDPGQLGSPGGAAVSSFLTFLLGGFLPVLPFALAGGAAAIVASAALGAAALFGVGAALGVLTGRRALLTGARMLAVGALASAVTFGVGFAIGVSTGV
jgi:VIT1/CCC1 family predicted Fe2+/Mn2+ transporter